MPADVEAGACFPPGSYNPLCVCVFTSELQTCFTQNNNSTGWLYSHM